MSFMNGGERRESRRCFVDTNLFVYAHDRTAGRKREAARTLISDLWEPREGCVNCATLEA